MATFAGICQVSSQVVGIVIPLGKWAKPEESGAFWSLLMTGLKSRGWVPALLSMEESGLDHSGDPLINPPLACDMEEQLPICA